MQHYKAIQRQRVSDEYLLMAGIQRESVLKLLIKSVKLGLAEKDSSLTVTGDYSIRQKDESSSDFTKRLLENYG